MDLAYLTAVARSTVLPPYDPWFAGGYINYYYLGQYVTATMLKLTSIPPEVAYNLAVPTFFALTVAGAFSVTYNLAEASRRLLRRAPDGTRLPRWSAYAAGVLGVFLVAFAGNLDGLAQLTDRLQLVSHTTVESPIPLVAPVLNSLGGLYQVVFKGADLAAFDFWRSSRMLGPTISITEFPYFSFLFADLHAHMMSFAFAILSIGLGLALANGRFGERGSWREWTLVALLAWVVGALRVLNSWDYPPFLLLGLAAVAISERRLEGGAWPATQRLAAKAVVLVGLSFALLVALPARLPHAGRRASAPHLRRRRCGSTWRTLPSSQPPWSAGWPTSWCARCGPRPWPTVAGNAPRAATKRGWPWRSSLAAACRWSRLRWS